MSFINNHVAQLCSTLQPHGLQHTRLPCPSPFSLSLLKLMSFELMMQSNHLILCHPLLLLPSIFSSIRVFFNESVLCIRQAEYWSVSFSISPSNKYSELSSFRMDDLISLQDKELSIVFSVTAVRKHQFFSAQPSLWSNSHIHT